MPGEDTRAFRRGNLGILTLRSRRRAEDKTCLLQRQTFRVRLAGQFAEGGIGMDDAAFDIARYGDIAKRIMDGGKQAGAFVALP